MNSFNREAVPELHRQIDDFTTLSRGGGGASLKSEQISDLEKLRSPEISEFANKLRAVLDQVRFDDLNNKMRWSYSCQPTAALNCSQIRNDLAKLRPEFISRKDETLIRLFILGESVFREDFAELFQDKTDYLLRDGVKFGLFKEERSSGKISTMDLLLCSRQLLSGEVIYLFCDKPDEMVETANYRQRVYLGIDSYYLNSRIDSLDPQTGVAVEFGSGSGIQLITLLKNNPGVDLAIGIEIDARARSVSSFNCALNGVSQRVTFLPELSDLGSVLGNRGISLAFSNPPFLPCPDHLIPEYSGPALQLGGVSRIGLGGIDGLKYTKQFIFEIEKYLSPEARVIIYSQFAGRDRQPPLLLEYLKDLCEIKGNFVKFPEERYRYSDDLLIADWTSVLAGLLSNDKLLAKKRIPEFIEQSVRAFRDIGVESVSSGFVEFSRDGSCLSESENLRLKKGEADLRLYFRGDNSSGLLTSKFNLFDPNLFRNPVGFNGSNYSSISQEISPKITQIDSPLIARELNGGGELKVGKDGDLFRFIVQDETQRILEEGVVYTDNGSFSPRYLEILQSVHAVPNDDVLRRIIAGRNRLVDGKTLHALVPGAIDPNRDYLLTEFPLIAKICMSEYSSVDLEESHKRSVKQNENKILADIFHDKYLQLLQIIHRD